EPARVAERARAPVGHERERAGANVASGGLQLLLRLADPGDLGAGVDHPRNRVEVDVRLRADDPLGDGDALFLALVGEHRPANDVADRPDVLEVGPALAGHRDETPPTDR